MDEKYRENFHDFLAIPLIHYTRNDVIPIRVFERIGTPWLRFPRSPYEILTIGHANDEKYVIELPRSVF